MNIHEHQAKALLKGYGLPVAAGVPIFSAEEAEAAAKSLPGPLYVVKSQIHAGGRGKGKFKELGPDAKGGVRLAFSIDEAKAHAKEMFGNTLVTAQTGEAGKQVNRLYIEDGADIARELYCSLLVDRSVGRVAFVVSTEGNAADGTVDEQRAIEFAGDVGAVLDVEAVDLLAGFAGLGGHQRVAEHFLGMCLGFVDREGETDAALGIGAEFLKLALAAAAGMDLALHHVERTRQRLGGSFGLFGGKDRHA